MKKEVKIALYSIPVLIAGYLVYKKLRKPKAIRKANPNPTNVTPPNTTATGTCEYPLKKGMMNCIKVENLQYALNNIPIAERYSEYLGHGSLVSGHTSSDNIYIPGCINECASRPLVEDGNFGEKTERMLQDVWNKKTIDSEEEFQMLLTWVVDELERQQIENPFVYAPPTTTPPPVTIYPPF